MSWDFFLVHVLGSRGIIGLVGLLIFITCMYYSDELFDWIESQTYGSRDYFLKQCDLMFYKVNPEHVTFLLIGLTAGLSTIFFCLLTISGSMVAGIFFVILFMTFGWQIPKPILNFMIEKRKLKFQGQMVDALNLISGGLRAGQSLPQAMGMVVQELPIPVSQEFNLVLQQNRLGMSLDESLENMGQRLKLEDVDMFVSSIGILRETGGNLSETFDTISDIIRERVRLQQKVSVLVQRNKMQGNILSAVPFGLLAVFSISDTSLIGKIFSSTIGIIVLATIIGLVLLGSLIIKKIVNIKT